MQLPFTKDAFLDSFGGYNRRFALFVIGFWIATLACVAVAKLRHRWLRLDLAFQWLWVGIAYHAVVFSSINPAAWIFAGIFLVQAILLATYQQQQRVLLRESGTLWRCLGVSLFAYGLLYPGLSIFERDSFPRFPMFALPCPLTILTIGWLLLMDRTPKALAVIPITWSAIGGSAAFSLGMHVDYGLLVAGVLLLAKFVSDATTTTSTAAPQRGISSVQM